jgi:antibiotic biosynthesis monooxygenase (ABM) superfamily enzyme
MTVPTAAPSIQLSGSFDTAELPRIAPDPVTVTVARTIVAGYEAEFLRWAEEVIATMRSFPGFLGAAVLHPGPEGGEYQFVFRFIDGLHLRAWERSDERAVLMAVADRFVTAERMQRTVGIDSWFELPQRAEPHRSVGRHIFTDVAWVYPVALATSLVVGPLMTPLPLAVRTALGATVITIAMRIAIGPMRSKLRAKRRL